MIKAKEKRQKASAFARAESTASYGETRPAAANPASVNREQFTDRLITFIRGELLGDSGATLDADTYLFDQGVIDSLKILRLIAFVEHWTGAAIPDSEIVMGHFRSVRTIAEHFVGEHAAVKKGNTKDTKEF